LKRYEVKQFLVMFFSHLGNIADETAKLMLQPFLEIIKSLKQNPSISVSILRELSILHGSKDECSILKTRIDRRYLRLCRTQEELEKLNLKKALSQRQFPAARSKQFTLEDYVFSQIDFSRYSKIDEKSFEWFFLGGIDDFSEDFFSKTISLDKKEAKSLIENAYRKENGVYSLEKESPVILSLMRTLETSLEDQPLITLEEISLELKSFLDFVEWPKGRKDTITQIKQLYRLLVFSLDGCNFTHNDGMETKLFIAPNGDLSAIFQPGSKAWTRVLIPHDQN